MIERWETVSDDGVFYTPVQARDQQLRRRRPRGRQCPTSTTNQVRLNGGPDDAVWTKKKTELDGHGRPIKATVYAQGSAPTDQITNFVYRADGTLQSVLVPDPTANNGSLVTYSYGFDSLGRATSIRRPDSTNPSRPEWSRYYLRRCHPKHHGVRWRGRRTAGDDQDDQR